MPQNARKKDPGAVTTGRRACGRPGNLRVRPRRAPSARTRGGCPDGMRPALPGGVRRQAAAAWFLAASASGLHGIPASSSHAECQYESSPHGSRPGAASTRARRTGDQRRFAGRIGPGAVPSPAQGGARVADDAVAAVPSAAVPCHVRMTGRRSARKRSALCSGTAPQPCMSQTRLAGSGTRSTLA